MITRTAAGKGTPRLARKEDPHMREWNKTVRCDCTTTSEDNLARLRAAVEPLG